MGGCLQAACARLALASVAAALDTAAAFPSSCGGVGTDAWTSPVSAARGYHVLCIGDSASSCSSDDDAACSATGQVSVSACWGGSRADCADFAAERPRAPLDLEEALAQQRPVANPGRHGRLKKALEAKGKWAGLYAFFRVEDEARAPRRARAAEELSGLLLVFEGGNFLWPGVEVGFSRKIGIVEGGEDLQLELITRSLQPLMIEVSSFLDAPECKHIIDKASPHIAKSAVSHMDHDVGKPDTNWRSSSTYFMPSDDSTLRQLDRRVSALTLTRVNQQEYAQVLRYNVGERYAAHHDYFDPKMYAKNNDIMGMTKKGLFNRLATVFFYLTTVEAGGHTNFPRAGGLPQPPDFEDCGRGVSVAPQEGRVIVFYSQDAAGGLDEYSLHGGCSVSNGTKWSANKWIWSKKMDFLRD